MVKRVLLLSIFLLTLIVLTVRFQAPVSAAGQYEWQIVSTGSGNPLYDVEYTGSLYVTVGYAGVILTSADSVTWSLKNSGVTVDLKSVVWNGRMFVAVGAQGTILTSTDGFIWVKQQSVAAATETLVKVIWDGLSFIAMVKGPEPGLPGGVPYGAVLKSMDGVNWSYTRTVGTWAYIADLLWNGMQYIAVGQSTGAPGATIYTSTDAVNWTVIRPGSSVVGNLEAITWNGSKYIAVGSYGIVATSSDFTNWTVSQIREVMNGFKDVAFNANGFVGVGGNGMIYTTTDGISWSPETSPTGNRLYGIKNNGSGFIAVGDSGAIVTSKGTTTTQLDITNDNTDNDGNYNVNINVTGIGNYTLQLFENNILIDTHVFTLTASAGTKNIIKAFTGKPAGTYTYRAELSGDATAGKSTGVIVNSVPPGPVPGHGKMEAEKMTLINYMVENNSFASGGRCIMVQSGMGSASITFDGAAGNYNIKTFYFDENDGTSTFKLYINGVLKSFWVANRNLGSGSPTSGTRVSRTLNNMALKNGDIIKVEGTQSGSENARIDYLNIIAIP